MEDRKTRAATIKRADTAERALAVERSARMHYCSGDMRALEAARVELTNTNGAIQQELDESLGIRRRERRKFDGEAGNLSDQIESLYSKLAEQASTIEMLTVQSVSYRTEELARERRETLASRKAAIADSPHHNQNERGCVTFALWLAHQSPLLASLLHALSRQAGRPQAW